MTLTFPPPGDGRYGVGKLHGSQSIHRFGRSLVSLFGYI